MRTFSGFSLPVATSGVLHAVVPSPAGMTEPVNAGVEAGVRLGLGKQAQDDHYTAAENISRRKLEVEIQAEEAPERRKRREVGTRTTSTQPATAA